MASIMPIAALSVLPITAVKGEIDDVTVRSALYIAVLTLLTGTVAHGLIVFAQRTVPVGTMSMLQVAQPALAVLWSVLLLSARVRAVQVVGMALVIAGLHADDAADATVAADAGGPARSPRRRRRVVGGPRRRYRRGRTNERGARRIGGLRGWAPPPTGNLIWIMPAEG